MNNLRSQGYRFVQCADGCFQWRHPLEILATDIDCTNMTDAEFEQYVIALILSSPVQVGHSFRRF